MEPTKISFTFEQIGLTPWTVMVLAYAAAVGFDGHQPNLSDASIGGCVCGARRF